MAALESGEKTAVDPRHEEAAVRDFLDRLVKALDECRPWPDPAYVERDRSEWPALRDADPLSVYRSVMALARKAPDP